MRTSPRKAWLAVAAVLLLTVAACGKADDDESGSSASSDESSETIKAAWIYVGPANDGGWSTAHDNGRKYVEEMLGDAVETTFKESIAEGPEVAQLIQDLIDDGNKIIFATSFGYGDAMAAAAADNPDVYFEHATGAETTDNLATYFGAGEDSLYLAGMTAGAATKSGKIGFVAPFPIAEVIRHINAYTLGAQSVNPAATVEVKWINSWFDPENERKAAESLIAGGADVIASGGDSPAPGDAAKEAGVPWTGYDSDQSENYADVWLTATVYDWGPYYLERVKAAQEGTWETGAYYGNIADGFTDLAPFGDLVTEETRTKVDAKKQEIVDGSFYPLTGPLTDQDGTERVPDGQKMTLDEILTMDWFVKGVNGSPKG